VRVLLDGSVARQEPDRACNYGLKVPCPNGGATLELQTRALSDGLHRVAAQALDTAGNLGGSAPSTICVDNAAPQQAFDVTLDGGAGWRIQNKFTVSWRNPAQSFAPIVAAEYQLCPTLSQDTSPSARAEAQRQRVRGTKTGTQLTKIENLAVPKEDEWTLNFWLRDAARNQQQAGAVRVEGLDYDITPPGDVAFMAQDPQDPARLRVRAVDGGSGIRSGAIEVRRDGENAWQPLPTEVTDYGLTAFVDDETLPKGVYFLRGRAADAVGLEQSSDRWDDGTPAILKLPIRLAGRLVAGRPGKRRCHRAGRRRVCRRRLATKPRLRVGRAARLRGRLTVNRNAMAGAVVEVWRQLDGGADWKLVGTVTTSRTGRFSYKARRGPARTIRFRYPGGAAIRGRNADVRLRVRASMGVDVLVSAPHTIAQLIEEQVTVGDVVQLLELAHGRAALIEATLPGDSPVVGRLAGEIAWPPDCVAAAVIRDTRVHPAPGDLVLEAGDRVLCVTDVAQMEPLHRLLGTTPPHR
jgi:hypothetical protein